MYLKTVELAGFKSFPAKTSINFEKGITAIIGPNGSGKSNISDSVRWVFGEMSSKVLRGAKMEDVIFGGTKEIKPSSFAKVSLIIDNSDKVVECDYSEIKITRQLFRSGESGYFLNDKSIRLKDIYELFLNTGVGKEGYSIIGQGKIAELIAKKSDDRRSIFEEASGISRYRYKKEEAEKKLSDVKENLTRVKDILSEIEGRIEPLSIEAEKARKYLDLYDKKKSLEIYVWVKSIEKIKSELNKILEDFEISKLNYDSIDSQINRLNEKIDSLYDKTQEMLRTYENRKNEKSKVHDNIVENKSKIDILKNDTAKLDTEIETNIIMFRENAAESEKIGGELEEKNEVIDRINAEYNDLEMEIEDIASYSEHVELNLAEKLKNTEELSGLILLLNEEINGLKIKISEKNAEIKHITEKKENLKADILKNEDFKSKTQKELNNLKEDKKTLETEKAETERELGRITSEINKLQKSEKNKKSEKDELYLECEKNNKYIQSLTHILEDLEGYPESVKKILQGKLRGIHGTIAQLISVDSEYTLAIETALSQNVQNIVVEDEEAAKEAINYLKENNFGRATFYPVSIIKGRFIELDKLEMLNNKNNKQGKTGLITGFIDIASNLVSCDVKYDDIVQYLLGRTIVCENIDDAIKIAKRTSYAYRIVTLDGQVVNAGGSFSGGSSNAKRGSLLSGKSEIESLKKKNAQYQEKQKQLQKEIDETVKSLTEFSARSEVLKSKSGEQTNNLYKIESEISLKSKSLSLNSEQFEAIEKEIEENEKKLILYGKNELELKLNDADKSLAENSKRLNAAKEEHKKLSEEKEIAVMKINQKKLFLAGILNNKNIENERLENLNRIRVNLKNQNEKILSQNAEKKSHTEKIYANIKSLAQEIINLEQTEKNLDKELANYENNRNTLDKESVDSRNLLKEKTAEKEIVFRELTRIEALKNAKERDEDNIITQLYNEYEMTFSDAKDFTSNITEDISNINVNRELNKLKEEIKKLGNVNVNAIEEFRELNERYVFLKTQSGDLNNSLDSLQKIIDNLETQMKAVFAQSMKKINESFKETFIELFGGGNAEIIYSDPQNVLESELEIEVQPPGKNVKHISLLSGGEQAFVAIALYFALLKINPAPFCILDEIEAALDEVNVDRFAAYLKKYSSNTQFIIISHRRGTMEAANRLYGITMQDRGISKYLILDINEIERKIGALS
ncbi:MAG: chromosome segregation protein SMC [Oscillospiraceae bacterium]|nr:chromosome segregation protein SMC [Oscillospiraceae bacterium]